MNEQGRTAKNKKQTPITITLNTKLNLINNIVLVLILCKYKIVIFHLYPF